MLSIVSESDVLKAGGGPNSRTARMGPEGQRVLENVRAVLRAFKQWGEEKNGDDLIQNFFVSRSLPKFYSRLVGLPAGSEAVKYPQMSRMILFLYTAYCLPVPHAFTQFPHRHVITSIRADLQYNAANADVDVDVHTPSGPSQRELSRDGQRAISSFRTIANLLVTNPEFRNLVSDFILLARDIFADAASAAADNAKQAAEKSRPSEQERQQGVDLDKLTQKGKNAAGKAKKTSGKQVKDGLWDEVEGVRQYLDDKLPEGEEAKEKIINRLQKVNPNQADLC